MPDDLEKARQLKEIHKNLKPLFHSHSTGRTDEENATWDANIAAYEELTGTTLERRHDGEVHLPFRSEEQEA